MVDICSLNDKYNNVAGEDIIRSILAEAKKPIATSKFGPNAESFIKLLSKLSPTLPIIWIDVVFDNQAFRENMHSLRQRYQLNVITLCASLDEINKYESGKIPPYDSPAFSVFQKTLKVQPFERFLAEYRPDYWLTDIRQNESDARRELNIFDLKGTGTVKVAPFARDTSLKHTQYRQATKHFNDVCKPSLNLECGLHGL